MRVDQAHAENDGTDEMSARAIIVFYIISHISTLLFLHIRRFQSPIYAR